MAEEFPEDGPRGYAAKRDGQISIRTASYREEAVMLNAVVIWGGVPAQATGHWTDETILQMWARLLAAADSASPPVSLEIVPMICTEEPA